MIFKSKTSPLTAARLRELFFYDPTTGIFTRKIRQGRSAGAVAGSIASHGYRRIKIDYRMYRANRLAWLYMTGEWPKAAIDHEDLDKDNNRWLNLRPATWSQNGANTTRPATNQTGFKGVSFEKRRQKYRACITVGQKFRHLGYFDTREDAHAAYNAAAAVSFGYFARAA